MSATQAPPLHWEADVLLKDGSTAHIRPIRPEDADLLVEFYARVSDRSKYYRFFSPMPVLSDRDVARFTQVDHQDRVAFVLLLRGQMIAVGRYDVVEPREAEVAFLVAGRPPGPRHRPAPARAPGPGGPRARDRAVRRRGAARQRRR